MKELDENQLRGWHPRRTSAGLRRKIFRAGGTAELAWDFSRFAPAAACLFFGLVTLHFNGAAGGRADGAAAYGDFANGSNAPAFSDRAQEPENHLASITFDWTNHSVFKSSMRSPSGQLPATNLSN